MRDGNILAAEFVNSGKTYRAVRYVGLNGRADYYTPDGRPVRKAFLRYPVDYARISSGFSLARRHPVLNRVRAHKGIDFAAPSGTPIKAAGSGRVASRGRNGGYGNAVVLSHGKGITTLYGHMSRYAKGLSVGDRVSQGQVIGYVGMTGLASGPHVHYEYRSERRAQEPGESDGPEGRPDSGNPDGGLQGADCAAARAARSAGACAGTGRARAERHRRLRRALNRKGKLKGTHPFIFQAMRSSRNMKGSVPFILQVENDDPQPQVVDAFGLRMTNCAPSRSSR